MPTPARRLIVSALLAASLVSAAPAAASTTHTKTVPATLVFNHGQRPGHPGNCSAVVFLQWADVPGTTNAKGHYVWKGAAKTKSIEAPFEDTFELVALYQAPPGFHWMEVGKGWTDGPKANTCEEMSNRQKVNYGTAASVELQVADDPAVCKRATARLLAANKAVAKATKAVARAKSAKSRKARNAKLKKARARQAKAVKRYNDVC
jgi:hypothetical protein